MVDCPRSSRQFHGRHRRRGLGHALLALAGLLLLMSPASFVGSPVVRERGQTAALQPRPPSALAPTAWGRAGALSPAAAPKVPRARPDKAFLQRLRALPNPFMRPEVVGEKETEEFHNGPRDFFLFIKDYEWSLRYRVGLVSKEESEDGQKLDEKEPLKLQWVKLKKPIKNAAELFQSDSWELFDWEVMEPARHQGFMYHVTRWIDSGVEAVINFFEGRGVKLLVRPDSGIQLLLGEEHRKEERNDNDEPKSVTHAWVETMGMPWLPFVTAISFFNLQRVIVDWHA